MDTDSEVQRERAHFAGERLQDADLREARAEEQALRVRARARQPPAATSGSGTISAAA